jgi:hypothetical protein
MSEYPVVFTITDVVSGNGFLAGVSINGRALIAREDGAWWTLGVRPAAIAESGDDPIGSYGKFRDAFKAFLIDTATAAPDFGTFKAEVDRFFYERDEEEEKRWHDAGQAIREKKVAVEAPFDTLNREPEPRPVAISVERLDMPQQKFTPSSNVNVVDRLALAPAA